MRIDLFTGRFGPTRLVAQDVLTDSQAADRIHVGSALSRTWHKIADRIDSTNRTEAKRCLFDRHPETTPHHQKIGSFFALREIRPDLRIVDGDPLAKIEIVGAQHLASRDNDTIQ